MTADDDGRGLPAETRAGDLLDALLEAIDVLPDGFVLYDAEDRLLLCNRAFRDFHPELDSLLAPGVRFGTLLAHRAELFRQRRAVSLDGEPGSAAGRPTCGLDCGPVCDDWIGCRNRVHRASHGVMFETTADGRWIRVDEHRAPSGRVVGLRTDLSDLRDAQGHLARSEAKFRTLFAMAPVGIVRTAANGRIVDANPAFAVITGSGPDDPRPFTEVFDPRDRDLVAADLAEGLAEGRYGPVERRLVGPDGGEVFLSLEGTLVAGEDGSAFLWSILQDVTERRRADARIWHAAHHDSLTELPNRKSLGETLVAQVEGGGEGALLLIDLDNFKAVNDTFGHEAGDHVLVETGRRLAEGVRADDMVARLGGDEFAAVLRGPISARDAAAFAERLIARLGRQVVGRGRTIRVGASIGVARFPEHGTAADAVLRAADHALLEAKRNGRNRVVTFHSPLVGVHRRRTEVLEAVRRALDEDRIVPHYQPIVDLESGAVIGFEALCRTLIDGEARPPSMEIFRDGHLGRALDDRMVERVIADLVAWRAAGVAVGRIDVNVGDAGFSDPGFETRLFGRLAAAGLEAAAIGIEMTETTLLDLADEEVPRRLERLRAAGIAIALDDFGTGHASLSHLKALPVDRVKIDRSFVADVIFDAASRTIVDALIGLGGGLGKEVVAEGVETAGQRRALIDLGCRLGQGHLFARPMPAAEVPAALAQAEGDRGRLGNSVKHLR